MAIDKRAWGENHLTEMQGTYKAPEGGRTEDHPQFTWKSFPNLDRKSKEAGMDYMRNSAMKRKSKILSASIMDAITGKLIEKVIIDPNYKPNED